MCVSYTKKIVGVFYLDADIGFVPATDKNSAILVIQNRCHFETCAAFVKMRKILNQN